jgi:hypothetical protein
MFQWSLAAVAIAVAAPAMADDLSGSDALLCASGDATVCTVEGDCETGPAWTLNIPRFIEVDLEARTLATTEASGENRSTPIENIEREGGLVFLQGIENGRAFSFVIVEASGVVSVAVAREDVTVTVFGSCTPLPE